MSLLPTFWYRPGPPPGADPGPYRDYPGQWEWRPADLRTWLSGIAYRLRWRWFWRFRRDEVVRCADVWRRHADRLQRCECDDCAYHRYTHRSGSGRYVKHWYWRPRKPPVVSPAFAVRLDELGTASRDLGITVQQATAAFSLAFGDPSMRWPHHFDGGLVCVHCGRTAQSIYQKESIPPLGSLYGLKL